MSYIRLAGTTVSVAATYGSASNMTAITNATEAVATMAAAHGFVTGDILEITSGWARLDKRLVRVKTVATNDITLEKLDTTNTSYYPSGTGTGTARKVATWTTIGQISQDIGAEGGTQQFQTIRLLDRAEEINIPTSISAVVQRFPLYFDPALTWLDLVRGYRDNATPVGIRLVYPGNGRTLGTAILGMLDTPIPRDGLLGGELTASYQALPITYAT